MTYTLIEDSAYRTWETRENPINYYGRLLHDDVPVICGHGGSMWLCQGCAERIMARESEWNFPRAPGISQ